MLRFKFWLLLRSTFSWGFLKLETITKDKSDIVFYGLRQSKLTKIEMFSHEQSFSKLCTFILQYYKMLVFFFHDEIKAQLVAQVG